MTLPKILVVEDEAITSLELTRMLKRWGFEVVGDVVSGQEALDMARDLKPDLIIMDIHLKGDMSGVDAAKEISKIYDVPIIFLTAHGNQAIISKAKEVKPVHYIIKPYRENELRFAVESGLEKHKIFTEMKNSDLSYRAMAKNIPGIVFRIHLDDGRIEFFNDYLQEITGYSPSDIEKADLAVMGSFIVEEDLNNVLASIHEAIETGLPYEVAYHIRDIKGDIVFLEEKGRPTLNKRNEINTIEGVIFYSYEKKIH